MFKKIEQLRKVYPELNHIKIYDDGSGHAESNSGSTVFDFDNEVQFNAEVEKCLLPLTKPLVHGDRVVVVLPGAPNDGKYGEVRAYDSTDNTYLVLPDGGVYQWYRRSSIKYVPPKRKVGDAVVVDAEDGIIVKIDNSDVPYLVALPAVEVCIWADEDGLA